MAALFFDIDPVAKSRPRSAVRNGRIVVYTDKKTRDYEKMIKLMGANHFKQSPLKGPLKIEVNFYIKPPKSNRSKYPTTRRPGDIDNLLKSLLDPLNGICWDDDSQITTVTASKVFREVSGIELFIYQLQ